MHSWLSFKDIFKASIDQNPNLLDAVKLQYLKSALKGDAFRIIQNDSYKTDSNNYKLAWSLLEERYSNPREQVYAHLKRFMSIPVIQNESASAILNLIDVTSEIVRSLECLEQKLDRVSSAIFAFILSQKLDQNTKLWWERNLKKEKIPNITELLEFLKDHARTLNASRIPVMSKSKASVSQSKVSSMFSCVTEKRALICKLCNVEHKLFKCPKFQKFSLKDRVEYVKKHNLCFCCFGNHGVRNCPSNYSCRVCRKKHNSLLCYEREKVSISQNRESCEIASLPDQKSDASSSTEVAKPFINKDNECFMTANVNKNFNAVNRVLLSTAIVYIEGNEGEIFPARTSLDSGSMIHLCSSELAEKLHLQRENVNVSVGCLSGISTTEKSKISAVILNRGNTYSRKLDFFVIPKITHLMPSRQIDVCNIEISQGVTLADPDFHKPGKIQLLLGSEIFFDLIRSGQIYVPNTNLVLQNSAFGYLVSGSIEDLPHEKQLMHCGLIYDNVEAQLKKFFDLESIRYQR
ncbi:uncharacterized protein LOC118195771 [Stegodyphus dumicola]|uniref:uncharacterized protein LOC118195771 n=1 Tax=Stegodyphus dumicola TaxID=202533 RepID=UPI0015A8DE81|nr:uncharacterized protein LOC118195771 [Stegodyphus dumicola]